MNNKTASFFQNRECEHFPCHRTEHPEEFNCLFCYCPLYTLGEECRGNYTYLPNGIKSCQDCAIPHARDSAEYICSRFDEIAELAKKQR